MNGPQGRFERRRPDDGLRINQRIRAAEIRVLCEGDQLGVMSPQAALRIAQDKGLDLVEISPRAMPPVCRIMDYGKYKYEEAKKKRQQRTGSSTVETKEIKFRPKTDEHDLDFKTKHIRRFIETGNKVRLVIVFKGREMAHPRTGRAVLDRIVERCSDIAIIETSPNLEGKRMFVVITPQPAVMRKAQETRNAEAKAQLAASIAKRNARYQPMPDDELDEFDEDTINADIDENGDDGEDGEDGDPS